MTFRTQSRVTPGVPGDNSAGATVRNKKGCWISNSRKVSSAAIGADTGKKPERALSKVVLPEPISPAIIRLPARLATIQARNRSGVSFRDWIRQVSSDLVSFSAGLVNVCSNPIDVRSHLAKVPVCSISSNVRTRRPKVRILIAVPSVDRRGTMAVNRSPPGRSINTAGRSPRKVAPP